MTSYINELWYGNLAPSERCGVGNAEVMKMIGFMERHRDTLWNQITDDQKLIFEKYISCYDEYTLVMLELAFREGFSIASRLLMDSLCYR